MIHISHPEALSKLSAGLYSITGTPQLTLLYMHRSYFGSLPKTGLAREESRLSCVERFHVSFKWIQRDIRLGESAARVLGLRETFALTY